jgi:diguanylate cyclase (GGDEF)-like protein
METGRTNNPDLDSILHIMYLGATTEDAQMITSALQESHTAVYAVICTKTLEAALTQLSYTEFDMILLDLSLPESFSLDSIRQLQEHARMTPIVVLTGKNDEKMAKKALAWGAQDFLNKNDCKTSVLDRVISYSMERNRLRREVYELLLRDQHTGLYNRRGFEELARQQLAHARRRGQQVYLFYIDLDGLKEINDKLGHSTGDIAIAEAADMIIDVFRESDIKARIGGDEFAILMLEYGGNNEDVIRGRIEKRLQKINNEDGRIYKLSMSMGVSAFDPAAPNTLEELLRSGDERMYSEKKRRKAVRRGETYIEESPTDG